MRVGRLIFTAVAAGVATLAVASPALAAVTLQPGQAPTTAAAFPTKDCSDFPGILPSQDGWHFVLPASVSQNFVSVTLTFNTPAPIVVTVTSTNAGAPSTGLGWSGYIDMAGGSGSDKHLYLKTTAGWTLTGGTAITNPPVTTGNFNLSHTCVGTPPSPSPSPRPSQSIFGSPTPGPSPSQPGPSSSQPGPSPSQPVPSEPVPSQPVPSFPVPSGGADTGGGGSQPVSIAGIGAIALAAGAGGLLLVARRRRAE